jgi:predicted Ser/Thr protein kinase
MTAGEGVDLVASATGISDTLAGGAPDLNLDDLVALRIGRFTVIRRVGMGGMGEVFAAYDEQLDRRVAVKLLRGGRDEERLRGRVLREAQAMARLSDPNVAQVYDVGVHEGRVFVAMEFVDGPTLAQWLRLARRSQAEILDVFCQAGRGLQAAHAAGLVHRDFKPDNALVGADGRVRVVDFGLARAEGDGHVAGVAPPSEHDLASALATPLTMTGALVGTPAYMSPEQWSGAATDGRSDQFSFCAALWEALYDQRPFAGTNVAALAHHVLAGELRPPPAAAEVPPRVHAALARGLAPDPAARFPGMAELLRQLDLDPRRDPAAAARSRRRFMIGFLVVGGVIDVWVQWTQGDRQRPEEGAAGFAGLLLALTLIGVLSVRRSLLQNKYHRDMLAYLVLVVGQLFLQRLVSAAAGYTMRDIFILDALGMALVSAAVGAYAVRWAYGIAVVMFAAALVSAALPGVEPYVVPITFVAAGLAFLFLWHRSASAPR